jgi:cytochrome c
VQAGTQYRDVIAMDFDRVFLLIVSVVAMISTEPAIAQDAAPGARVFSRFCSTCHASKKGETVVGPSLFGVVGRAAGSMAGFRYSAAMRDSRIVWNAEALDGYLELPKEVVPGTTMTFRGLKDARQRADLVRYLETLR